MTADALLAEADGPLLLCWNQRACYLGLPDLAQDRVPVRHDVRVRPQVEGPEHGGPVLIPEERQDVTLEAKGLS